MELTQLRYFCEIAHTQHMTKSAARLHVAQPALSQAMRRLENELGVKLFERQGRNIRLTRAGASFHKEVAPLLAALDAAANDIRTQEEATSATVRVGIFSASSLVVDALASFLQQHAETTFEVVQDETEGPLAVTVRTEFPHGTPQPSLGPTRTLARFHEAIGVAMPLGRTNVDPVNLDQLQRERFIGLAGSRSFRHLCDRLCAQRGFQPSMVFDSDSPAVVKKMIGLGLGVGFWPEFSWGPVAEPNICWVRLDDPGFQRTLVVERTPCRRPADEAAAQAFGEFLANHLSHIFPHPTHRPKGHTQWHIGEGPGACAKGTHLMARHRNAARPPDISMACH